MNSIVQMLKLIRFPNLAIIAITQFISAVFLIDGNNFNVVLNDYQLLALIISTLLIASGGYIINDYYDIKIDYVNKPDRVVIGKHIKRRQVLIIHSVFNFSGILLGAFVSWWVMGINIIAAFMLWLYSNILKRLPLWGNLTVSFLTGLSVLVVFIFYRKNLDLILMYSIFAFFISLIREIVKDIEDIEGDEKFGCNTLPIAIGVPSTKKTIYGFILLFLIAVFIVAHKLPIFWPFFISIATILSFLSFRLYYADKKKDYNRISLFAKAIMIIGILSMMLV